jgi:hypothetical protein
VQPTPLCRWGFSFEFGIYFQVEAKRLGFNKSVGLIFLKAEFPNRELKVFAGV